MKKITNFTQIKEIIEPIPADMFITGTFGYNDGKSCFLGHIHRKLNKTDKILGIIPINDPTDYKGDRIGYGASRLTEKFLKEKHNIIASAISVNDTRSVNGYNEPVIKDRLMHMINDAIAAGY
jgi:hypothetical protein